MPGPRLDENAYQLLGIIQSHAPTGNDQALMARIYNETQANGANYLELEKEMAMILVDGLRFGNWPWSEAYRPHPL